MTETRNPIPTLLLDDDLPVGPTEEAIKQGNDFGNSLTHWLFAMTDATDVPQSAALFSIWVNLTHVLADNGWSTEELIDEVREHGVAVEREEKH